MFDNSKVNNIIFGVKNKDQMKDILEDADKNQLKPEIIEELICLEINNFNLNKDIKGFKHERKYLQKA